MAMLGAAAIAMWMDVPPASTTAHDDWHSHEHLAERLAIPGFRRGRRAIAADPAHPHAFILYELADAAALVAPAYLARLNDPTPWSRSVFALVRGLSRTLCRVAVSAGTGVGSSHVTVRLSAEAADWTATAIARAMPSLVQRPGITGVHLLRRDEAAVAPQTEEQRARGGRDASEAAVLLIEGYEDGALRAAARELAGAGEAALYRLAHVVTPPDLAGPVAG